MQETVGQRLKSLIDRLENENQQVFANNIGKHKQVVNRIVNDKVPIGMEIVRSINKGYPYLNLHWLITGLGPMFIDEKGYSGDKELEMEFRELEKENKKLRKELEEQMKETISLLKAKVK